MRRATLRIDPLGYALEAYDSIGRRRQRDLGTGRSTPLRTCATAPSSTAWMACEHYLVTTRRDAIIRQFCRKLLGYALGPRDSSCSDLPLLEEMDRALKKDGYRFSAALECVVASRQFREIRGKDASPS